jgi:hypothetical protein
MSTFQHRLTAPQAVPAGDHDSLACQQAHRITTLLLDLGPGTNMLPQLPWHEKFLLCFALAEAASMRPGASST